MLLGLVGGTTRLSASSRFRCRDASSYSDVISGNSFLSFWRTHAIEPALSFRLHSLVHIDWKSERYASPNTYWQKHMLRGRSSCPELFYSEQNVPKMKSNKKLSRISADARSYPCKVSNKALPSTSRACCSSMGGMKRTLSGCSSVCDWSGYQSACPLLDDMSGSSLGEGITFFKTRSDQLSSLVFLAKWSSWPNALTSYSSSSARIKFQPTPPL
jgi:hypothetical protein